MFSILIPSWNNLAYLRLCVDSIRRRSSASHQIIVHVNDGSDGTLAWVQAEQIEFTHSATNVGVCWAVNEAAMLATHEHIVYLNDDMIALPGWDAPLLARARAISGDLYMVSGTMIEPRDSGNRCVVVADYGDSDRNFREQDLLRDLPRLARPDWSGATWPPTLVHRRTWFRCGGYSTEFSPGMSSDNDFSMKLWQLGCRHFIGVGNALVYHFQCKSTGKVVKNDGRRQFLHKWGLSQRQFDRLCLRRGEPLLHDRLPEPEAAALRWASRVAGWRRRWG